MELELRSVELQGAHKPAGCTPRASGLWVALLWIILSLKTQPAQLSRGAGAPPPSWTGVGPLVLILSLVFFINSKNILREVSGHSENFYFCTKITPWQFCWKQRQFGLVPFKSCKLESKTRAKVFGKVDTMETYQLHMFVRLYGVQEMFWRVSPGFKDVAYSKNYPTLYYCL